MQTLSKLTRRVVPALLATAILAQSALAANTDDPKTSRRWWQELRHLIVQALDELHVPPG